MFSVACKPSLGFSFQVHLPNAALPDSISPCVKSESGLQLFAQLDDSDLLSGSLSCCPSGCATKANTAFTTAQISAQVIEFVVNIYVDVNCKHSFLAFVIVYWGAVNLLLH